MKRSLVTLVSIGGFIAGISLAQASNMVYHGINPDITPGAPQNPNYIASAANSRPVDPKSITTINESQQTTQNLISQYVSQLSGACPAAGCPSITLPDGTSYVVTEPGGKHTITITSPDGGVTTLTQ